MFALVKFTSNVAARSELGTMTVGLCFCIMKCIFSDWIKIENSSQRKLLFIVRE